jgi:acetyl esterase/lipase
MSAGRKAREVAAQTVEALPTLGINQAASGLGQGTSWMGRRLNQFGDWAGGAHQVPAGQMGPTNPGNWKGWIPHGLGNTVEKVGPTFSPIAQVATAPFRYTMGGSLFDSAGRLIRGDWSKNLLNTQLPALTSRAGWKKGATMNPRAATVSLITCLCLLCPAMGADKPVVVELWPGKVPDETDNIGPEKVHMSRLLTKKEVEITESTRLITNVTKPTITIYRPAKAKDTGAAMLICPGGGYWDLYWELEGEEVAAWLNSIGVTGIILKYRVPRRPDEPKGVPARRPLQDAQRAVSLVRSRAKEFGIDPKRIGMVGFSAGGHLAIATATSFETRTYEPVDAIDKVSCRPDFAIPIYAGYLKQQDKNELAPGLRISAGTPPIFLAHGGADIISPPEHSVVLYLALKRAGIPTELHIYSGAAHDFGVRPSDQPCSTWTKSCAQWLRQQGFLNPSAN